MASKAQHKVKLVSEIRKLKKKNIPIDIYIDKYLYILHSCLTKKKKKIH